MNVQRHCKSVHAIFALTVLGLCCAACSRTTSSDRSATATAPTPVAAQETFTSLPSPTVLVPTDTHIPTSTVAISTATAASLPTSTRREGWVDFINTYYGYAISLPPSAVVSKVEVNTIPGTAQPLTFAELNAMYPPGMCVGIGYGSVDLTVRVAGWLGGEFGGPCARTGIGVVYPVWTQEQIVVGGQSYPATHGEMYENESPDAKLVEDFYYVEMGDGALIYFGSKLGGWQDQDSYEQYLKDKDVVFEILRSYRVVPRTELYCPDPTSPRRKAGEYAYVSTDPPLTPNNVREEPGINQPLLGTIAPGRAVEILEGPVCNNSLQWFKVHIVATGLEGWTPEGDHDSEWLVLCKSKENCGMP
jgi:hypothetical protein